MKPHIEYTIKRKENRLHFQITRQYGVKRHGVGRFLAKNGWSITSYSHPQISKANKSIYLRGETKGRDRRTYTEICDDRKDAIRVMHEVKSAIREFNNRKAGS